MIDACIDTDRCPRCGGTGDDGGFLACQQCNGMRAGTDSIVHGLWRAGHAVAQGTESHLILVARR